MPDPKDKGTQTPPAPGGSGSSPDDKNKAQDGKGKEPEMVSLPKAELDVIRKIGEDFKNYGGAVSRLDNKLTEVSKKQDELNRRLNNQLYGDDPAAPQGNEDQGSDIARDLDRNASDVLASQPELQSLPEDQKQEFESEWQMRLSHLRESAVKSGKFVTQTELKNALTRSLRSVTQGEDQGAIERARAEGAAAADARGQGSVSSASSVDRKANDVSAEAMEVAKRSQLVADGKISLEEMARRVQSRLESRAGGQ